MCVPGRCHLSLLCLFLYRREFRRPSNTQISFLTPNVPWRRCILVVRVEHEADTGFQERPLRNRSPARSIDCAYSPVHFQNGLFRCVSPTFFSFIVELFGQSLLQVHVQGCLLVFFFLLLLHRGQRQVKLSVDEILQLLIHLICRHFHLLTCELLEIILIRY